MSIQVSYKKQIVVGIIMLIIVISVVEVLSRLYEIFNPDCTFLNKDAFKKIDYFLTRTICQDLNTILYEDFSIITVISPNQHLQTININTHGFRGEEISKEKSNNEFRIFVIGGSTAYGYGATSDETTIPGYLQKKFDDMNLDFNVEVINAGLPAADSFIETFYIKNKLLEFEPDLFIIYDGWNDLAHNVRDENKTIKQNENTESFEVYKFKNFPYYRTPFVVWNIFYSQSDYWNNFIIDESKTSEKISLWKKRWIDICELGKKESFSTLLTIQPMLGTGNKVLSSDEAKLAPHLEEHFGIINGLNEMASTLLDMNDYCDKTADLRNSFDGISEPIFYDVGHTNDFGNEIIAQQLFELSLPMVLDRR